MIVLTAEKLSKSYTERMLLKDVTFGINDGDKIGVIGVNGTGKSTLLKIIAGVETPDSGCIIAAGGIHVGYLPQNPEFEGNKTILEQAMDGISASAREFKEYECKTILTKLGMTDFDMLISTLSGGQKKKVAMASALVHDVELLVLDEPTNHIDNDMVTWLEQYLSRYPRALLMVTHDRYFLDRVTNRILEVDKGNVYAYDANYSKYLELKAQREEMAVASERKRQTLLKKELEWIQRGARARTTKQQFRVNRFHELNDNKVSFEKEKLEVNSLSSRLGKKIVEINNVSKWYGEKCFIKNFSYQLLRDDRVGIIGPNGCGKSTLLKMICGLVTPDEGEINIGDTVKIGYFSQECEEMDTNLRVIDYIKDIAINVETVDGMLTASQMLEKFLFDGTMQYTQIGRLSGGERRRLFLLSILMKAPNILLLDEPTNDLDIETLTILEDYLDDFGGGVITVSHDRYFLDRTTNRIFAYQGDGEIGGYMGNYSDYLFAIAQEGESEKQQNKGEEKQKNVRSKPSKLKFTYHEQKEYETIDETILQLEASIKKTEEEMVKQGSNFTKLQALTEQKETQEQTLSEKTERWVYLMELAEQIENQGK